MTLGERCARIWSYVQHAPRQMPSTVRISSQHVEKSGAITSAGDGPTAPTAFVPDEHYFQVRVNEMFLVNQREWFKDYDPIAFVTTEFLYQDQSEALPFVVGPSMMQNFQSTTPTGMIFANTGVAGPHPYRGGALKLTMILGRIERTDHARRFLGWIDNATKIFDFATALGAYLKVSNLILDGIEALTGNGGNNLLAGLRNEINPDAGDTFIPGYYALIDQPGVKPEELWVRDNQLYCGGAAADLKPFRNADYLLYSIMQTAERTDLIKLPYYSDYERVIGLAAQSTTEDQWKATKADMSALFLKLRLSPDLTRVQAEKLRQKYVDEMVKDHQRAVEDKAVLGPRRGQSEQDAEMRRAADILDL